MKGVNRLQNELKKKKIGAIYVSNPSNIRFLSGFTDEHDGRLLVTKSKKYLLTDFRLLGQAKSQAKGFTIVDITKGYKEAMAKLIKAGKIKSMAYEADHMTMSGLKRLNKMTRGVRLVSTEGLIEALRMVKDAGELKSLKAACALTTRAFGFLKKTIRAGMTEQELAWGLECYLRERGSEGLSFPSICASGANSANPHHLNTKRKFRKGDTLILDFGAVIGGMHADMTRTVFLGQPKPKMKEVYETVLKAQKKAIEKIRPGISGVELDTYARDYIKEAGYGKYFGHGTGHGIGLDVHELPRVNHKYKKPIPKGSCITIEPGIYIAGLGGVRIEDDFLVTNKGREALTKAPKNLSAMILKV